MRSATAASTRARRLAQADCAATCPSSSTRYLRSARRYLNPFSEPFTSGCGPYFCTQLTRVNMFSFHELLTSPLFIASAVLGFIGATTILAGLWALVTLRPLRFLTRSLVGFVLLTVSGITGVVAVGIQGYRALTREEVAAHVWVRPTAPQRFAATMRDPDGREQTFDLAGDEIYIDAHI